MRSPTPQIAAAYFNEDQWLHFLPADQWPPEPSRLCKAWIKVDLQPMAAEYSY